VSDPRVIVALDVSSADEALKLVEQLDGAISFYKVGLELFAAAGLGIVAELRASGLRVFCDLKLHDIGETVKRATNVVAASGADYLTVHAFSPVVRAAAAGREETGLRIIAVTVLTSLDAADLREDGHLQEVKELVELRVRNAIAAGADGLVCSPLEVARVREIAGPHCILITPGVRSAGAESGDQKRVATPRQALESGSSHVVIGREITRAANPRETALRILDTLP
jgi:orotidine-5'-phosphate decarboxylase